MTIRKQLKIPNYNCTIHIMVTDEIVKEANKLFKKYKAPHRWKDAVEGTLITDDLQDYYLLLNTEYLTYNTITHENFHAAMHITKDRGIFEEESQAWLNGYINENVFKFLEKKKFTITHG